MSSELYVVPRFWDEDSTKFNEEGFEGWMIFGILGVFNFLYYSDIFAERYLQSQEFNPSLTAIDVDGTSTTTTNYGGVGSAFFSQLAFKSIFGIGQWVRIFLNWTAWFVVAMIWCLTLIPGNYLAEIWLFNLGAYFMGTLHLIRTAFLVVIWAIAIAVYDNYTEFYRVYDYFAAQDAWGHRMKSAYYQVNGWGSVAGERGWTDYELEMATSIGLFVGIPLLAPRYHAALKKVEAQNLKVKNEYLNAEKQWRKATLQKIAVKKAQLAVTKAAERKEFKEKQAIQWAGRGSAPVDDEVEVAPAAEVEAATAADENPEETSEWL